MALSETPDNTSLDLALVGNGAIGALIDAQGTIVWCCFPRFDGDPVFGSLLAGGKKTERAGTFAIELVGAVRFEQQYAADTPILVTRCYDRKGAGIEITDFCPRFDKGNGNLTSPPGLVRQVRPIGGKPNIMVRVTPASDYGCNPRQYAIGPNHIAYAGDQALRLTTNAPTEAIVHKTPFDVHETLTFIFGVGEQARDLTSVGATLLQRTERYWRSWVRELKVAGEWRDAVVRAAITLELNVYESTGAIIAAMTTSIPEAPDSGRTWDYRYCWPRDACFVVNALSRVGEIRTTDRYLGFLLARAESTDDARLSPMYAIDGAAIPDEHVAQCLAGYRGMGPVHIGNKASEQQQNDIYGEAVLTAEPLFARSRTGSGLETLFARLEAFGQQAVRLHDVPDAGLWELRGAERVHTFSSMMCWVACDRLARYADSLKLKDRAEYWRLRAASIHDVIALRSWNTKLNAFTATMEGDSLDASLLLMPRLGFLDANDPRFVGTVAAIESQLKHGDFVYRYIERDDFGYPENAFLVCTFWYIEALAAMGGTRREEARLLFEKVLAARNRHGLLAEDLDPKTLEQWGNFPQTYCMAGIIDCAIALAT